MSFKHLQVIIKMCRNLLNNGGSLLTSKILEITSKVQKECIKVGEGMMFNLRLNFFASYSAVVEAGVARIHTIVSRVEKLA